MPRPDKPCPSKRNWIRSAIFRLENRQTKISTTPVLGEDNNYKLFPKRETKKNNNPYKAYMYGQRRQQRSFCFSNPADADLNANLFKEEIEIQSTPRHKTRLFSRSVQFQRKKLSHPRY